jgi:hypothetical protein
MGPTTLVLIFLGVFALAILQGVVRRKRNPYAEVAYAGLPDALRGEIERILPGLQPRNVRMTKDGDEARLQGEYQGRPLRIEAEFDRNGALIELEVDGEGSTRTTGLAAPEDLPEPAAREIERVLGDALPQFERSVIKTGTSGGQAHFEVEGRARGWKWEIAVGADGRLIELEMEKRRQR